MRKVAIVTDTTACVPSEQVSEYEIEVVPVQLIFEDKTYRDGIDITPTKFYTLLRGSEKLPTTSASSPSPYKNGPVVADDGGEAGGACPY